jgi:hypothetical protein
MKNLLHSSFSLAIAQLMLLPLLSFNHSGSPDEWQLRRDNKGVKVYSRKSAVSSIDELKVELTVRGSLSAVTAVLMDAANYPNWVYGCSKSKIIKHVSATEQYQYQLMSAPFPFSDRDVINRFTVRQNAFTGTVYTASIATPDYLPETKGAVRLPYFEGRYELRPLNSDLVAITYTLSVDPGGSLPDWLVNLTFVTGPYESLSKLQGQIDRPQYKDQHLPFIQEP